MLQRFLCICSGAPREIIAQERFAHARRKHAGLGALVLLVATYAAGVAMYAASTRTNDRVVIFGIGVFWGTAILIIDRQLLMGLRKRKNGYSRGMLVPIAVRVVIAGLFGFVMAAPITLWVFDRELGALHQGWVAAKAQEREAQAAKAYPDIRRLEDENAELSRAEQAKHGEIMEIDQRAKDEGNGRFGQRGAGFLYAQDTALLHRLQAEFDTLRQRHASNDAKLDNLRAAKSAYVAQLQKAQEDANGLGQRLKLMEEAKAENSAIWWAHWLLTLLLMSFELTPVALKVMMPRGPDDAELESQEERQILKSEGDFEVGQRQQQREVENALSWTDLDRETVLLDVETERQFRQAQRQQALQMKLAALLELQAERQRTTVELLNRAMSSPVLRKAKRELADELARRMAEDLRAMVDDLFSAGMRPTRSAAEQTKASVMEDLMEEVERDVEIKEKAEQQRRKIAIELDRHMDAEENRAVG